MPKNELSKAESREVALNNREQIQGLQNLLVDNSDEPIKHPLINEIFSGKKGSSYFKPSN